MGKAVLKFGLLLAFGLTIVVFNSCEKDNSLNETQLTTSVSSLNVPAVGGEFSISLETNAE